MLKPLAQYVDILGTKGYLRDGFCVEYRISSRWGNSLMYAINSKAPFDMGRFPPKIDAVMDPGDLSMNLTTQCRRKCGFKATFRVPVTMLLSTGRKKILEKLRSHTCTLTA